MASHIKGSVKGTLSLVSSCTPVIIQKEKAVPKSPGRIHLLFFPLKEAFSIFSISRYSARKVKTEKILLVKAIASPPVFSIRDSAHTPAKERSAASSLLFHSLCFSYAIIAVSFFSMPFYSNISFPVILPSHNSQFL